MSIERQNDIGFYGYKSINELVNSDCTPLLDILLKLSSIASNFASAANNTKNITIEDKHEVNELLELVFDVRRVAEKVEKLMEERIENNICVIKTGVFEHVVVEKHNNDIIEAAIKTEENLSKLVYKADKKHDK